jgi:hypothetical protein
MLNTETGVCSRNTDKYLLHIPYFHFPAPDKSKKPNPSPASLFQYDSGKTFYYNKI